MDRFFKIKLDLIPRIILCVTLSVGFTETYSQNIDGVYSNGRGERIRIKDDLFYYERIDFSVLHHENTILCATCSIKKEKNGFFSIYSVDNPMSVFIDNMELSATYDSIDVNSLMKIRVSMPSYHNRFNLEVITPYRNYFFYDYYSKELITISKENVSNIIVKVYNPYDSFLYNLYDDINDFKFIGTIPFYETKEIPIGENIQELIITFRDIDDYFFAKNYIKGEFFKVDNNRITWRGDIYVSKGRDI